MIKTLQDKLKNKEISSRELAEEYFRNIEKYDPTLQAFMTVTPERGFETAEEIDKAGVYEGVSGIPMALKDNISVKDIRLTASSRMLEEYISPYDATVVKRLKGGLLMGKTNLDAFAFGASTENSGYMVTKNPWNTKKVAGGSSGGSAAAVASGMAVFALGTDTGGSIRQPAGFCGVVGLKPTYGRSSRYGLAAMGSSLDCPGPITTSVEDAAIVLQLISGVDPMDATSVDIQVPDFRVFESIKGKKAGLPKEFFDPSLVEGLDAGVKEQVLATVKRLQKLGVEIVEVSMPYSVFALPVYYIITPSEISANMTRYDGIRYGHTTLHPEDLLDLYKTSRASFEDEVKRRIFVGNYALSSGYYDAYYNKAMQVRTLIIEEMHKTFEKVDFIVGPTSPTPAFGIGENTDNPVSMYLEDIYTVTANIAGVPAISIPCGLSDGLPVGFQIIAKQFDEKTILDVSFALEQDIAFAKSYTLDLTKL